MPLISRRAKRSDIKAINSLLIKYGLSSIDESYINPRDLCLVAEDAGKIVGLLWIGLMCGNKKAYLDYFTVDAEYAGKRVGHALATLALKKLGWLGTETFFGIIARDKFHDKSAFNALRMGLFAKVEPHTFVYGSVAHSIKELSGVLNGR